MPVPPKEVIITTVATTATADKRTPLIPPLSLTLCYSSIAIHFLVNHIMKERSHGSLVRRPGIL